MAISYKKLVLINTLPYGFITHKSVCNLISSHTTRRYTIQSLIDADMLKKGQSTIRGKYTHTINYYYITPIGYAYVINQMERTSTFAKTAEKLDNFSVRHGAKANYFNRLLRTSETMEIFREAKIESAFAKCINNVIVPTLYNETSEENEKENDEEDKDLFFKKCFEHMVETMESMKRLKESNSHNSNIKEFNFKDPKDGSIFYTSTEVAKVLKTTTQEAKSHTYMQIPSLFINCLPNPNSKTGEGFVDVYIVRTPLINSTKWIPNSIERMGSRLARVLGYSIKLTGIHNTHINGITEVITMVRDYEFDAYQKLADNECWKPMRPHWLYGEGCFVHYFIATNTEDVTLLKFLKKYGNKANEAMLKEWNALNGEAYTFENKFEVPVLRSNRNIYIPGFLPETNSLNAIWKLVVKANANNAGRHVVILCTKDQKAFYQKLFASATIKQCNIKLLWHDQPATQMN